MHSCTRTIATHEDRAPRCKVERPCTFRIVVMFVLVACLPVRGVRCAHEVRAAWATGRRVGRREEGRCAVGGADLIGQFDGANGLHSLCRVVDVRGTNEAAGEGAQSRAEQQHKKEHTEPRTKTKASEAASRRHRAKKNKKDRAGRSGHRESEREREREREIEKERERASAQGHRGSLVLLLCRSSVSLRCFSDASPLCSCCFSGSPLPSNHSRAPDWQCDSHPALRWLTHSPLIASLEARLPFENSA